MRSIDRMRPGEGYSDRQGFKDEGRYRTDNTKSKIHVSQTWGSTKDSLDTSSKMSAGEELWCNELTEMCALYQHCSECPILGSFSAL